MYRKTSNGGFDTTTCPDCFTAKRVGTGNEVEIQINYGNLCRELPIENTFKPVKTKSELLEARDEESMNMYWWEAEILVTSMLVSTQQHLYELRFRVSGYENLSISFERTNGEVTGISLTGDIPKKKQFLNIYQKARLARMGFQEQGDADTIWHLPLGGIETTPSNLARIVTHVVQFGWLLNINDAADMTPYIDTASEASQ